MARINTKDEFRELSARGQLGNFLRSWDDLEAFEASGYQGYLTIRAKDKQNKWFVPVAHTGGWHQVENQNTGQMVYCGGYASHLEHIQDQGGPDDRAFYFQEIPNPGLVRTANIEVGRDFEHGMELYIETATINPVRGICDRATRLTGSVASRALWHYLSPESVESLYEIWERYPNSTIEATEFGTRCGAFNQKLVVWEVRNF